MEEEDKNKIKNNKKCQGNHTQHTTYHITIPSRNQTHYTQVREGKGRERREGRGRGEGGGEDYLKPYKSQIS